ncbi:glycosyltransferase family 15 [Lecanosticta acicola]|uniref:Glycosyltransferase family 15 n=1 Tax=Lecanosticta acicola TaxID=111012 RepID=A0AAI8YYY7_9PEZI|nr:glycosyltransferase family 15 [Lecanosticta acicola]
MAALSRFHSRFAQRPIILFSIILTIFLTYISLTEITLQEAPNSIQWHQSLWKSARKAAHDLAQSSRAASIHSSEIPQSPLSTERKNGRMNATFVSLARDSDLPGLLQSIRDVEDRFNVHYNYDWVFLNDDDFTEEFIKVTSAFVSGRARYGRISKDQWSLPSFIDEKKAEQTRIDMKNVKYGDSASYRHMCRYQSGFFYKHPLVEEYEWYWRVEPDIKISCDVPYDPFRWMAENGKKYGFVISLNEISATVPSLWNTTKRFIRDFPQHVTKNNNMAFLSEDEGETTNYCHFWSNFEIANLNFFRSQAYNDFFNYLDHAGGFFYERWGDASVHSIAASLMLEKGEVHYFNDIGYRHSPLTNCPRDQKTFLERRCLCDVGDNMDWSPSCTKRFFETAELPFPEGFD